MFNLQLCAHAENLNETQEVFSIRSYASYPYLIQLMLSFLTKQTKVYFNYSYIFC